MAVEAENIPRKVSKRISCWERKNFKKGKSFER
jgi:hypothetical protein